MNERAYAFKSPKHNDVRGNAAIAVTETISAVLSKKLE